VDSHEAPLTQECGESLGMCLEGLGTQ
jgi:hypothetical protein